MFSVFQRPRSDSTSVLFVVTWLNPDFVEHILSAQRISDALRLMLGQRVLRICAGNLEDAVIQHNHAERTQRHTRRNLYLVHSVDTKSPCLFDPILDEWIAQGMFCF